MATVYRQGSIKRHLGRPLADKNKRAYFGPEGLPNGPDVASSGHLHCRAFKRSYQMRGSARCAKDLEISVFRVSETRV